MQTPPRSYIASLLQCRCPRCREGHMYRTKNPYKIRKLFAMYERCPVCGQLAELEVGFYYGTGYVSYGLGVGLSFVTLALYWLIIGISYKDNSIYIWLASNITFLILIMPYMARVSRIMYLSFFVKYDPMALIYKKGQSSKKEKDHAE